MIILLFYFTIHVKDGAKWLGGEMSFADDDGDDEEGDAEDNDEDVGDDDVDLDGDAEDDTGPIKVL